MPLDSETRTKPPRLSDDVAYMLPMGAFLAFLWVGGTWKAAYPTTYVVREVVTAGLLIALRGHYTKIRWNGWWLGLIVGVIGIVQWLTMQHWLETHLKWFKPSGDVFDPFKEFATPATQWAFITVRIIGAAVVVPFMEELFWRDYLWRQVIAPNDFKLAHVGEWDPVAVAVVCGAFATVHGNWWLTAIVWGAMIAALLIYTKSLGACIIAHATTNALLAAHVLRHHEWALW